MNKKYYYRQWKELKTYRDEALVESNYGRKRYLLFKMNVKEIAERGDNIAIKMYDGYTYVSDNIDDVIKQAYRFSVQTVKRIYTSGVKE